MKAPLRQLALDQRHREQGATFVANAGWRVPAHYGDPAAEYRALRQGAGLADWSANDRLELRGADRVRFLQGLVTLDVAALAPGAGGYGFFTTVKGHVLADVVVRALADRLWLELPAGTAERLRAHLERYVVADRVDIAPLADMVPLVLAGAQAPAILRAAGVADPALVPPWGHIRQRFLGTEFLGAWRSDCGVPAIELLVSSSLAASVYDELRALPDVRPVGEDALLVVRLEHGVPRFGADFTEDNLPQETGREDAVSYTKGCYLGQEVVARLHYRGQASRQLGSVVFEPGATEGGAAGDPSGVVLVPVVSPGATLLLGGRPAGTVTSVAHSPALGRRLGLAMLQRRALAVGTRLELTGGGTAEVVSPPFGSIASG